jgi:hypothetical protein
MPAIQQYICSNQGAADLVPLTSLCQFVIFILANRDENLAQRESSGMMETDDVLSKTNPLNFPPLPTETQLKVSTKKLLCLKFYASIYDNFYLINDY